MMTIERTIVASDATPLVLRVSGVGPAVVFVHGSNGGLDSWAGVAADLAGYSSWSFARRGHRPSGASRSPNTFAVEAQDALAVVRAAAAATAGPVHLVGGSYGATVALHAVASSTVHIASLALFEPPLLLAGPHLVPVLKDYVARHAAGEHAEALGLFLREMARVPEFVLAAASSGPADPDEACRAATAARGDLEAMAADDVDITRWAGIDVPVLLMQGADTWEPLPTGMARLAATLPQARRIIWQGQSHFVTHAAPELVSSALRDFWRDLAG